MIGAYDAQPGCLPADRLVPTYKQVLQLWSGKLAIACGMAKIHLELFQSKENQPFYACGDKNTIRAYVNTPATATLAIGDENKQADRFPFFSASRKTLKINLIR